MSGGDTRVGRSVVARDPEESRWRLHRAGLCPHRLEVIGPRHSFAVRHRSEPVGSLVLGQLVYDTAVQVTHRHGEDSYVVHVPLVGEAASTVAGRRVLGSSAAAVVIAPGDVVSMHWQAHSPHLMVRLDARELHDTLARRFRRPQTSPRMPAVLDLTSPRGRGWLELVSLVQRDAGNGARLGAHELTRHHVQQLVVSGFLLATGHLAADDPESAAGPAAAPAVRRARDLIHAHAAEPLTVADLAEAVGVGVRSLQQGFRRELDTTPTGYLRQVRLARVRAELATAGPTDHVRVTDVASRWGFLHPGRFSQTYRATYGEPPSATLAREPGVPRQREG